MKFWQSITHGDIVDIVAPGSGTSSAELEAACAFLQNWGLVPRVSSNLFSGHPYLSNDDQFRFLDLKRALWAKDSKLVWCLRGGYGAVRLLPLLAKLKGPKHPKLLIGYSDITSLHLFLQSKWKWISCHGPLLEVLPKKKYNEAELIDLKRIIFGEIVEQQIENLRPMNKASEQFVNAKKAQVISAPLVGGNLTVLNSHWGSFVSPQLKNKILFLEEIGERGYRVDRNLTQLQNSGKLADCKAILLGDFLGGDEANKENFVKVTLENWASAQKIPIFAGLPIGHGTTNKPLFLGTKVRLISNRGTVKLQNPTGVQV
jgi:muramoyltetrapeptide carboxypeptidase